MKKPVILILVILSLLFSAQAFAARNPYIGGNWLGSFGGYAVDGYQYDGVFDMSVQQVEGDISFYGNVHVIIGNRARPFYRFTGIILPDKTFRATAIIYGEAVATAFLFGKLQGKVISGTWHDLNGETAYFRAEKR